MHFASSMLKSKGSEETRIQGSKGQWQLIQGLPPVLFPGPCLIVLSFNKLIPIFPWTCVLTFFSLWVQEPGGPLTLEISWAIWGQGQPLVWKQSGNTISKITETGQATVNKMQIFLTSWNVNSVKDNMK